MRRASRKYEEIEEEYSRGLVALVEGREDEALGHFRKVLEWDSRHFNTLIKIGEVLRSQERHSEAIEYHRKAQNLKDDNTRPLYALVEDYEAMGEMGQARGVLGKIIAPVHGGRSQHGQPRRALLLVFHVTAQAFHQEVLRNDN